jgi:hypothetical protein
MSPSLPKNTTSVSEDAGVGRVLATARVPTTFDRPHTGGVVKRWVSGQHTPLRQRETVQEHKK